MTYNIYTHRLTLWTQLDEAGVRDTLSELAHITVTLENDKVHAVSTARKLGLSWEEIARELNVSKQTAWNRWSYLDDAEADE